MRTFNLRFRQGGPTGKTRGSPNTFRNNHQKRLCFVARQFRRRTELAMQTAFGPAPRPSSSDQTSQILNTTLTTFHSPQTQVPSLSPQTADSKSASYTADLTPHASRQSQINIILRLSPTNNVCSKLYRLLHIQWTGWVREVYKMGVSCQ